MSENRLSDCRDRMQQAAMDACAFTEGRGKTDFLEGKRTHQAGILRLIIMDEAATRVTDRYAESTLAQTQVPWRSVRSMRGLRVMRNRIAQGCADISLDVVWGPVQTALPTLPPQLSDTRQKANDDGKRP